jgi:hypothetical protein
MANFKAIQIPWKMQNIMYINYPEWSPLSARQIIILYGFSMW